jgi:hypothetical protein
MRWCIKLVVSALLLGWVLRKTNTSEILHHLSSINLKIYAFAVALAFSAHLLNSYKWQRLLRALGIEESCVGLWALNLISLFYSVVLPGQIFGEAVKAFRLARGRQGKSKLVMSVIIERLTAFIALLCLGLVGMTWIPAFRNQPRLWMVSLILLSICLLTVATMLTRRWQTVLARLANRLLMHPRLGGLRQRLESIWAAFTEYRHSPGVILFSLLLSFAFQGTVAVVNYSIAKSIGLDVPLVHFFWISAIVAVVQMLPVTLAGVGLRENVLVYVLALEGIGAPQAFAYSLVMFSVLIAMSLTGGLLDLLGYPRTADVSSLPAVSEQPAAVAE